MKFGTIFARALSDAIIHVIAIVESDLNEVERFGDTISLYCINVSQWHFGYGVDNPCL